MRTSLEILRMISPDSGKYETVMEMMDKQVDELTRHLETLLNNPAVYAPASSVSTGDPAYPFPGQTEK